MLTHRSPEIRPQGLKILHQCRPFHVRLAGHDEDTATNTRPNAGHFSLGAVSANTKLPHRWFSCSCGRARRIADGACDGTAPPAQSTIKSDACLPTCRALEGVRAEERRL